MTTMPKVSIARETHWMPESRRPSMSTEAIAVVIT